MSHRPRRFTHHADTPYTLKARTTATRREQSEAFGQLQSLLLFERTFRPRLTDDPEQRQALVDLAIELGVAHAESSLFLVSTAALFERVRREVAEGRALAAPLLGTGLAHGAAARASYSEAQLSAGEEELKLLRRVYGVLLNATGKLQYTYRAQGRWCYRVEEYLADRAAYLGVEEVYLAYKEQARRELDAGDAWLRRVIEPPERHRKANPDWAEAQDIFYAWVRRGYQNKLGPNADISALIRARMSLALREVLKSIRVDSGVEFKYGGFNPRPMKQGGYRLGTISDHAFGTAVDIEADSNAQVKPWAHIENYTGLQLDRGTRRQLWTTAQAELHRRISELSSTFARKIAQALEEQPNLDQVIHADRDLAAMGDFVRNWRHGFFSLPWPVVRECHKHDLVWGATFTTPDLHHFEIHTSTTPHV